MCTKTYIILMMAGSLFFGCESGETKKETEYQNRISELEAREQELQQQLQEKDSAFTAFMQSITGIEKNLQKIRAREMNIEMARQEEGLSPEDLSSRISEDIAVIDKLIKENKQAISNLSIRLRRSQQEKAQLNATMEKMREDLNTQILEREKSIELLKGQLDEMQSAVKVLHANVDSLSRMNDEKIIALNTAYYVVGDFKELKDEEILNKEGGFLGFLGRVKMLRDDFNQNKFTRIDIQEQVLFPVEGTNLELVTVHPPDSYKIEKEGDDKMNLIVSDPEKFWKSSKYLVMLVK